MADRRDSIVNEILAQREEGRLGGSQSAAEAAAARLRRAHSPERGRLEGALTAAPGELLIPQSPAEWGLAAMGPAGRAASVAGRFGPPIARGAAAALGFGLEPDEAQARTKLVKGAAKAVTYKQPHGQPEVGGLDYGPPDIKKYVDDPQRIEKPGVYQRPDVIAHQAERQVAPEHPALKNLFGVTRGDLFDISQAGRRQATSSRSCGRQRSRADHTRPRQ